MKGSVDRNRQQRHVDVVVSTQGRDPSENSQGESTDRQLAHRSEPGDQRHGSGSVDSTVDGGAAACDREVVAGTEENRSIALTYCNQRDKAGFESCQEC